MIRQEDIYLKNTIVHILDSTVGMPVLSDTELEHGSDFADFIKAHIAKITSAANWKDIRKDILKRADNKCEFCGIENYAIRENGSKVVLTIAHLDHTPENCDYSNLRALCQKCHNRYDAKHRAETRRKAVE